MNWYYLNESAEVVGPLSEEALKELSAVGALTRETQVCREGTQEWISLTDIPGMESAGVKNEQGRTPDTKYVKKRKKRIPKIAFAMLFILLLLGGALFAWRILDAGNGVASVDSQPEEILQEQDVTTSPTEIPQGQHPITAQPESDSLFLAERLRELHRSWTATAGEPTYDLAQGMYSIPLSIEVDEPAYAKSASQILEFLETISLRNQTKIVSSVEFKTEKDSSQPEKRSIYFTSGKRDDDILEKDSAQYKLPENIPKWLRSEDYKDLPESAFWIWICVSERNGTTEWKGYAIEADMHEIGPLLVSNWSLSVQLRDEKGAAIASFEVPKMNIASHYWTGESSDPLIMKGQYERFVQPGSHLHLISLGNSELASGVRRSINPDDPWNEEYQDGFNNPPEYRFQCLLSPMFISISNSLESIFSGNGQHIGQLFFWKSEIITAQFQLSPDDVNDIRKTEISIKPEPRTN